ncbi:uncharacterized protein ACBR49_015898 [Aulostomus maculatus]
MGSWLREFLVERNIDEDVIQKLEEENIDETVIPLMTDSDLAKFIPKIGDRVSTVAFCRQAAILQQAHTRRASILSRLQERLTEAEGLPSNKKSSSKLAGNTNAKRKMRRIEVGWMDFDEREQRYRQVKSVNGGGTNHISIGKVATVADIQVMAEKMFFPNGYSKKNKSLSQYSTHMESSQTHVDLFNTVEELYERSKVKILRLYLCTKKRTGQPPSVGGQDYLTGLQPALIDLTNNEQNSAFPHLLGEESQNQHGINDGASTSEDLDDTSPLDEGSDAAIKMESDSLEITVDESLCAESSSCPLIVRRAHCLWDLISAFRNPDIIEKELNVKMCSPDGVLEEGEGIAVLHECLTEFWMDFYESCTLGAEGKVPFIRHDFQHEEWQAVARMFVVGWNQAGYFPVKLAIPFLEEALYGSTTSSFKDSLLLYVSQKERDVLLKALEDFDSVDTDELLDVLGSYGCKQVPTKDTLHSILAQIGHKVIIQAPMYVIKCWHPILASLARLLPPNGLHHFIEQKKKQMQPQHSSFP